MGQCTAPTVPRSAAGESVIRGPRQKNKRKGLRQMEAFVMGSISNREGSWAQWIIVGSLALVLVWTGTATAIPVVLLQDSFEGDESTWDNNWDAAGHDWYSSPEQVGGDRCAGSRNNDEGTFTCDPLDASTATQIDVSFYYMKDDTESTDLTISFYNGTSYIDTVNLGTLGTDDTWLPYSKTLTDTQYFVPNFRIQFSTTLNSTENVWVDDVLITMIPQVPEPGTMILLGLGIPVLLAQRRKG